MNGLLRDGHSTLRRLIMRPGYLLTAVAILGLGIAACVVTFTFVRNVLLAPLPYPDSDQIVTIWQDRSAAGGHSEERLSIPAFAILRDELRELQTAVAELPEERVLTVGEAARRVTAARVSSGYFSLFGASPVLGRDFQRDDERVMEDAKLVILSHRTWTASFGRDPEVVGREILLDDEPYRVIGVAAEGFGGPREEMEAWTPLRSDPEGMTHAFHLLRVYGRTSNPASFGPLNLELGRVGATLAERFPTSHGQTVLRGAPLKETLVQPVRAHLLFLFAGVMALMALACVTAGNMTAAAVRRRRKELAIRGALGASRIQVLRLPLLEVFALVAIASVIGTLLAAWGLAAARELAPATMPRLSEVHLDSTVLLFAAAVAAVAFFLIGVLAAAQATRISLARRIPEPSSTSLRSGFVGVEVALATGLTVLALLLVRSYLNLNAIDPGFHADGVLTAEVSLPAARYGSEDQRRAFFDELSHRAGEIQGVTTLGEVSHLPLGTVPSLTSFQATDTGREISAPFRIASPGYFEAIGIPILQGQVFATTADPRQIMVSAAFAARMWPDRAAVGQTLNVPNWEEMGAFTVSGVVGDVREELVTAEPVASVYLSTGLIRGGFGTLVMRFDGDPLVISGRVNDLLRSLDPVLPPPEITSMESRLATVLALPRMQNRIFSSLSGLAILLAVAGAYGVAHFSVSSRTRELGVRIAIGAAPARIVGMVLRETGFRVMVGVSIGIAGALYASRFVRGFLYGLEPTDPSSYALVAFLLFGAGLLAAYFPARRAARVDPMIALRAD